MAQCIFWRKEDSEEDLSRLDFAENPYIKWCDVVGLREAKETLIEALIMPLKFPYLFTSKRRPWSSILLYGPPGTGKSLLAQAITQRLATEVCNPTFIRVSNCLEENEGLLEIMIMNKRAQSPMIVLIDEIDEVFSSESARRTKMDLLMYMYMQDQRAKSDGILILATTSDPWSLDYELLKRFEKKIYTPLPNLTERLQILKFCLHETRHNLTEGNLEEIARKTEGYSGGDISALVKNALMQPIRKVQTATHYKRVSGPVARWNPDFIAHDLLTPCSPDCLGAMKIKWDEIPSAKLVEPLTDMLDMLYSLALSKPTTDEYDRRRYEDFQKYFC